MADSGVVNIRGKEYNTVAKRVVDYTSKNPDHSICSDVISSGDTVLVKTTICDKDGRALSTGYAEELRGATNINKTSAVENCETSAVGRALAFRGYGGTEIASANEVNDAIIGQAKQEVADYFKKYIACVSKNIDVFLAVRDAVSGDIENGAPDVDQAAGLWYDMSEEDQYTLYGLAPSKGGIFTTAEREFIKTEIPKAYNQIKGDENG